MKLLLIDDEAPILETLSRLLTREGYECRVFNDPKAALADYQAGGYNVVITDLLMPEVSGIDVLRTIRQGNKDIPVFILTGHADINSAIADLNLGANGFFLKPPDINLFLSALQTIEEQWTLQREKDDIHTRVVHEYKRLKTEFDSLQFLVERIDPDALPDAQQNGNNSQQNIAG
jgi:DNA-binding NtrC family response regulator